MALVEVLECGCSEEAKYSIFTITEQAILEMEPAEEAYSDAAIQTLYNRYWRFAPVQSLHAHRSSLQAACELAKEYVGTDGDWGARCRLGGALVVEGNAPHAMRRLFFYPGWMVKGMPTVLPAVHP